MCADLASALALNRCACHPRVTRSDLGSPAMLGDARKRLGAEGEELAARHLRRRGFEIVDRNYRTRWGELDIVAFDGRVLAFCEVNGLFASVNGGGFRIVPYPIWTVLPSKETARMLSSSRT